MIKKPTAILSADRHYRDTIPSCRKDDFIKNMFKKHFFIENLQKKYNIPCLDGADFFNSWDSSAFIEGWLIKNSNNRIITTVGNHEMPDHNTNKLERSSLSVLEASGTVEIVKDCYKNPIKIPSSSDKYDFHLVYGFPYGSAFDKNAILEIPKEYEGKKFLKIAIAHIFAYTDYREWMSKDAVKLSSINRLASQFDLIVTGHNHMTFSSKTSKNLVVNPGSMTRTTIKQIDFKPSIFLWFDETNDIEQIYLPIENNVIYKDNIKVNTFLDSLENDDIIDEGIELLFKNNLQIYYNKNNIKKEVIDFINKGWN